MIPRSWDDLLSVHVVCLSQGVQDFGKKAQVTKLDSYKYEMSVLLITSGLLLVDTGQKSHYPPR